MTQAINDFLDQDGIGDGPLSPEQAAALMALAEQGDTGVFTPDNGGSPEATTATDTPAADAKTPAQPPEGGKAEGASATVVDESQIDPSKAVVLAKDGVHHIPYGTLEKARQGEQHWKAQAEANQRELEELKAQAEQRADAGVAPTKQDNMVAAAQAAIESGEATAAMFGDFSEEALAAGIAKLIDARVESKVDEALKPLREREAATAKSAEEAAFKAHMGVILEAHPDAVSVNQSTQLQDWIKAQPSYAQAGIRHTLAQGDAKAVIEVFDQYKAATKPPAPSPAPSTPDPKAVAQAAIAAAKTAIPETLSGIPGGRAGATSVHEQLEAMDGPTLGNAMAGMTQAQIESYLNRNL